MSADRELIACPWCGADRDDLYLSSNAESPFPVRVVCARCGMHGPDAPTIHDKPAAVAQWNAIARVMAAARALDQHYQPINGRARDSAQDLHDAVRSIDAAAVAARGRG